ncbi:DUF1028 domain-containing protein [Ramlibacter sp.]|uniref:DUF1028 domain-containing protein n=1 Tax=Ramlibacter sp. TaxID=1917967 RepID=UPI002619535C|nr:DUF1028 domain-containing protein [Ramlibacter sp.]MDB5956490.1 hypothetical protein [Ramlibacter sp.]
MSHSILARCARTGQFGIALASVSLAAGADLDAAVRPNVGAILIRGARSFRLNRLATNLLAQGHGPAHVLRQLEQSDSDFDLRQVAIIDRESTLATHSGAGLRAWSGLRCGSAYAVLCEHVADERIAAAMAAAFEAAPADDLDHRLLCALEAGTAAAGSSARPGLALRSAALVTWGRRDYSDLEVRVDLHEQPVKELRRVYADMKPSVEYYEQRARNPSQAMHHREFAGLLKAQQTQDPS